MNRIVLPVTYAGELPCADCPGIQLTLTLLADSSFRLRRVYEERPVIFRSAGRWSVEENGTRLVLREDRQAPRFFQIAGTDSILPLDNAGRPIQSPFSLWLRREPGAGGRDGRGSSGTCCRLSSKAKLP